MDRNDTVFCVKAKPPKNWEEVVGPMNEYLSGKLKEEIDATFAHRRPSSSHANSSQQDPVNSPCVSFGFTHRNGSRVLVFCYSFF